MIDGKRVKMLAVTSKSRLASLPDFPSLAEAGVPNFEMQSWQGVFAPVGIPQAMVDRLSKDIAAVAALPDVQTKLRALGVGPDGRGSKDFASFPRAEIAKWDKVISSANIKTE